MSTKAQHVHPILRTPGMPAKFERLRFMTADPAAAGTPGPPANTASDVGQQPAQDANGGPDGQAGTDPQNGAQTGDGLPDDPAKLKAEIERLRRENASARTNAKQTAAQEARDALVQDLGKALGLVKDGDTATTPEQLTAQATAARDEARVARVELAVFKRAAGHNADPAAVIDSRTFLAKVTDLDPTAADFGDKVDAAIKAAITDNPKLLAARAAGASSVDHAGGTGEATDPNKATPGQARMAAAYASSSR
ncbi:hypothetical protein IF650_13085 [Cellulosimicrobium terreum]|nr:hypothetical protein [Cellulosimicrobium terreum]